MRENAKESIQALTDNNNWLFSHMVTVIDQLTGSSNGIDYHEEDFEKIHYKKGTPRVAYRIKRERRQRDIEEAIRWLESYKENWNTERFNQSGSEFKEDFYQETDYRQRVVRLLELLQI